MKLTGEDLLKLNVLMAQKPRAVRIKENTMQVFGLTDSGDACISLNNRTNHTMYLRAVREFLADKATQSAGGFPIHITGWTRIGQTNLDNMQQYLLLGEPEAVSSVVTSSHLTPEIGNLAWWCVPESENARRMLENPQIVDSELGKVLADHLYEHLAFETDPKLIVDSVRLMLQKGLLTEDKKDKLWNQSQRKVANLVGFLQSAPDAILHGCEHHPNHATWEDSKTNTQNIYYETICWFYSSYGQGYLKTILQVLKKVSNQDVVVYLLETIQAKLNDFIPIKPQTHVSHPDEILLISEKVTDPNSNLFEQCPLDWKQFVQDSIDNKNIEAIRAMLFIAYLEPSIVTPVFSRTTAEATLMRKKLAYITEPIFEYITTLLGENIQ